MNEGLQVRESLSIIDLLSQLNLHKSRVLLGTFLQTCTVFLQFIAEVVARKLHNYLTCIVKCFGKDINMAQQPDLPSFKKGWP